MKKTIFVLLVLSVCYSAQNKKSTSENPKFSFEVTADMRNYAEPEYRTSEYFQGVCEAIKKIGRGEFMVSPGDIDPPFYVEKTISEVLGEEYFWYPVLGNHEVETEEDMRFLNSYLKKGIPNIVNTGPENSNGTIYSFDYVNSHFIVINQYFDGESASALDGDISDALFNWLVEDLAINTKEFIFIFGHEPLISMPDYDNGRIRHKGDNLDKYPENSFRFQQLIRDNDVTAYFVGHTHNFSFSNINDIIQIDAGHSRGKGDLGAQSTFLKVYVYADHIEVDVYRSKENFIDYYLAHQFVLE